MINEAKWITWEHTPEHESMPQFTKRFTVRGALKKAELLITALGVYTASINGRRVGDFVLAPGWTAYQKRLQYQSYDVTALLCTDNTINVILGRGWYHTHIPRFISEEAYAAQHGKLAGRPLGMLALLTLFYTDGSTETICSDETWRVSESAVRFSDIYDGEIFDAAFSADVPVPARIFDGPTEALIRQEGAEIREQERISAARLLITPKGEYVLDFGQNLTGYIEIAVHANEGDVVDLSFAEVLDQAGNFYTANYRSAKAQYIYYCKNGFQRYKPLTTFYGFRFVRINRYPGGAAQASPENFTAVAVYSEMKRTGRLRCSNPLLSRLFSNVVWGQKCNFLDVPTDCPQRDERLGWTGDAQVFAKTACLNFDTEQFFKKWLADLRADQRDDGYVGQVIPDVLQSAYPYATAAWGDAAVIVPWEVFLAYGNASLLERQYASMCRWISYMTSTTKHKDLWIGVPHRGDWLGLDAPAGSRSGASRPDYIASAYYAYSTSLVIKAGTALGKDVSEYEALYRRIVREFRAVFPDTATQTECALAICFHLAENPQAAADELARRIHDAGDQLQTGFVGTPYLLHALSAYGYTALAYSLLLREEYPSWLYPVKKGATTIWEHWDGIMPDGSFWSPDMNSFNHYAYGAVADWAYCVAAGITPLEPGYRKIRIAPHPDPRLDWLQASLETRSGTVSSEWRKENGMWRFDITTPAETQIVIGSHAQLVAPGSYVFWSERCCGELPEHSPETSLHRVGESPL